VSIRPERVLASARWRTRLECSSTRWLAKQLPRGNPRHRTVPLDFGSGPWRAEPGTPWMGRPNPRGSGRIRPALGHPGEGVPRRGVHDVRRDEPVHAGLAGAGGCRRRTASRRASTAARNAPARTTTASSPPSYDGLDDTPDGSRLLRLRRAPALPKQKAKAAALPSPRGIRRRARDPRDEFRLLTVHDP
jgi:hypothetical protein